MQTPFQIYFPERTKRKNGGGGGGLSNGLQAQRKEGKGKATHNSSQSCGMRLREWSVHRSSGMEKGLQGNPVIRGERRIAPRQPLIWGCKPNLQGQHCMFCCSWWLETSASKMSAVSEECSPSPLSCLLRISNALLFTDSAHTAANN